MPTEQELHDAALQFVRKISGFHKPSQANEPAFTAAVQDVSRAGRVLFEGLQAQRARDDIGPDRHRHARVVAPSKEAL
jgi:hypothetical protein